MISFTNCRLFKPVNKKNNFFLIQTEYDVWIEEEGSGGIKITSVPIKLATFMQKEVGWHYNGTEVTMCTQEEMVSFFSRSIVADARGAKQFVMEEYEIPPLPLLDDQGILVDSGDLFKSMSCQYGNTDGKRLCFVNKDNIFELSKDVVLTPCIGSVCIVKDLVTKEYTAIKINGEWFNRIKPLAIPSGVRVNTRYNWLRIAATMAAIKE